MGPTTPPRHARAVTRRAWFGVAGRLAVKGGVLAALLEGFRGLQRGGEAPAGTRGPLGIVRPPGARAENDFLAHCIRCTRCADACRAHCIRLFGPDAGAHHGTPYIMPREAACTMCLACGPACPTGAIEPLAHMTDVRMGVAVVDKRLCVSHNGTGVCGACHTICPLRNRAIVQDYRNAPYVQPEHCTGCGLCEEICIVRDRRAIRVTTTRTWGNAPAEVPA